MKAIGYCVGVLAMAGALTIWGAPVLAQQYEAAGILNSAAKHLGTDGLDTLSYSAAGNSWSFGQPYSAGKALPKQNYRVTRSINFNAGMLADAEVRSRAEPRGGGALPPAGERIMTEAVGGNVSWNVVNMNVVPDNRYVAERVPMIGMNPHGIIKAALKNNATLTWTTEGRKSLGVVSFTEAGRYSAKAYINDAFEVERIEALIPDPVLGDLPIVTRFAEYRAFGDTRFPTRIEESRDGQMTLQLVVTDVQPNAKVDATVPPTAANFKENVVAQKLADGVWLLAGGAHNSLAVEMKDHVVVVEGPLGDARAQMLIDQTRKLIPGKPIRYVLNTHMHLDHAGGLGAFAAEGATIVTHRSNKAFFDRAFAARRTVSPDALAISKKKAIVRGVGDKFVLSDGNRSVEMHLVKDSIHNDGLMMMYLPGEKLLIQADTPTFLPPGAKPPAKPDPVLVNFAENVDRLKLDVDRIVPIHGAVHPYATVKLALSR